LVRLTLEAATVPTADTAEAKFIASEIADALSALRTVGLSLSGDDRQAVVDMLAVAGSWPDAVRDTIKALGVTKQPRWQTEGYDEAPTLAVVQAEATAAQAAITKEAAMQSYRDVHSAHIVPVLDSDGLTIATLAEAFRDAADALDEI
jgi:lambda repressor-like predicted transcriptional regulator